MTAKSSNDGNDNNVAINKKGQNEKIAIHKINSTNFLNQKPQIKELVLKADLVALDLELSGLGERSSGVNSKDLNERYLKLKQASEDFCIVSIGITCFIKNTARNTKKIPKYQSYTFNLLVSDGKSTRFSFESAKFLAKQGFDFNELFQLAIPYIPAHSYDARKYDEAKHKSKQSTESQLTTELRDLIISILRSEMPIAIHNGLIDLIFLFSHFVCPLPSDMNTFKQDITMLCGNRIYDTKLIANMSEFNTSFLTYVFRKLQRENSIKPNFNLKNDLIMEFVDDVQFYFCGNVLDRVDDRLNICEKFAKSGWCERAEKCKLSHNIDVILNRDCGNLKENKHPESKIPKLDKETSNTLPNVALFQHNSHNAGFDSYMCGYAMLAFLNQPNGARDEEDWFGKVSLPAFDIPLVLAQSTHYKNSSQFLSFLTDWISSGKC